MILTVCGTKGGTGKSTITTNISAWLANNKKDVLLIDANPGQTTSSNWVSRREEKHPIVNCIEKSGDIRKSVLDLSKRYEELVIDVGGVDSTEIRTSLLVSDLAIIPIKPSQSDLETIPGLSELIKDISILNPKLKAKIIISQAPNHPGIKHTEEAKSVLIKIKNISLIKNVIHSRKAYIDCMTKGIGVVETTSRSEKKAKEELLKTAEEIYNEFYIK